MEYCLETNNLCKAYGHQTVLKHVTMHIPTGAIYGFVGRNGSGKTTLIRAITGLQQPTSGSYSFFGIRNDSPDISKVRKRMGAVVESPAIYRDLSARDNLLIQARVLGLPDDSDIQEVLELVDLADTGGKKVKNFSLGMRQRLGIAIVLLGSPDFLILDEPVNGLDPQGIVEIRELILKLNREQQVTVLISSHILTELSLLATHYGFIDKGSLIKEISAKDLEDTCRKCIHVKVSNERILCTVLDRMGLEYQLSENQTADIFGTLEITEFVEVLHQEGCIVYSISEKEESLENYYINLIGGVEHE